MTFCDKPFWCSIYFFQRATWELKNLITDAAMEVMMVGFPCFFVECPKIRVIDPQKQSLFQEALYISVDSGSIQCGNTLTTPAQNILDSQGPI